jgi:outer membrane protein OmpA-like peptidoglycan-associated protein
VRKKIFIPYILALLLLQNAQSFSQGPLPDKQKETLAQKGNNYIIKGTPASTNSFKQEVVEKPWADFASYKSYKEAENNWQQLLVASPNNANLNYKAGLCYFFSYDEQLKALPYLKKAVKNMSGNYSFSDTKEERAPYTSLYFLAETFLESNQPDSALKYFSLYQDKQRTGAINTERGMSMSVNAKNGEKNLRNVSVKNMGTKINSPYAETNPVVKLNNSMMFFASRRPNSENKTNITNSEDIYFCNKDAAGTWSDPQPFRYNTEFDEAPVFISPDGLILYFRKKENGNADFYSTKFENGAWTKPEALSAINTDFNEETLSITGDGKTMYFSSDRNKEAGKYDIFRSKLSEKGKWSDPVLLSRTINTKFDEVSPYITPDGSVLFFCSNAFAGKGLGGMDVYYSELKKEKGWQEPQSLGYPINKTRNDINYYISSGDKRFYSSLTDNNSYDLFEVEGGGFDFESLAASTDVVTVTNEMGVTQLLETEKKVEKEVEVTQVVETEVEKEKEVEVNKPVSEAENKEVKVSDVNVDNLTEAERKELVEKVKKYLAEQLATSESVKFKVVYFDFNKSNLNLLSLNELKLLVEFLGEHPETKIEIAGHGDNKGSWQTNLGLSNKRAKEVYDFLMSNNVSPDRMFFYGKGSAVPIAPNDTEENRGKNRRVEVFILK